MWRINAVQYYRLLLFFLASIEIVVLFTTTGFLFVAPFNQTQADPILQTILLVAVIITLLMVLNLLAYSTIFHIVSVRADRNYNKLFSQWLEQWTAAFFSKTLPPKIEVHRASANALLELIRTMPTDQSVILMDWAQDCGIVDFWTQQLESNAIHVKLQALDALATLGQQNIIADVLALTQHSVLSVRIASIHTTANIIQRMSNKLSREVIHQLGDVMISTSVPVIVLEEAYILLDNHAHELTTYILQQPDIPLHVLIATINSVGVFHHYSHVDQLAQYLHHPNPTVRVVTLRAFAHLKTIPDRAFRDTLNSIRDNDKAVRQQALTTISTIPLHSSRLALWLALGDEDWWVSFAAGRILYHDYGEQGRQVLNTAAQKHPKPIGRTMAAEMLKVI